MTAPPTPPSTTPLARLDAIAALTAPGQPFELERRDIAGRAVRVFKHAPPSLRAMYEQYASDLPFLIYEDERLSFAGAWRAASRIGHVLVHDCGVRAGDRVAIAMRNYPEWILAFTAITSIGAVAVAMNAHWQPDELAYGLADSGARVLLADQERLDRLARCAPTPGLQVLAVRAARRPDGARALSDAVAAVGDVAMPAAAIAPDDLAILLYTSGSSGRAKGVPSTHRNIVTAMMSWGLDLRTNELVTGVAAALAGQPGTLLAVPLFHVTGLHASYLLSYGMQRRIVCMYRWDPELAARLIDRERLTSIVAPAAITGDLVRVARAGGHDLSSLLTVGGGGAPRAPEQVRQIAASFGNALPNIGWGMTETNAIGTSISGADYLARPDSSGRCSQVLELSIRDDDGRALPAGQRGELWVRGTAMFRGYWNLPEATAAAFVDDWFRTGDGAYLDDEGFLFIVDRLKDLIIRGGENISAFEVENVLFTHPKVAGVALVSMPDPRLVERACAFVIPRPGPAPTLAELVEYLEARKLARHKFPERLELVSEFPMTPSGKVQKYKLREVIAEKLRTESARSTG